MLFFEVTTNACISPSNFWYHYVCISPKLLLLTISYMILNDIYNSFFLFYMWNLIYFQSITYFLYFFLYVRFS
ncbi:hypothetical protein Hanom_Chr09g00804981 [Helianthus anomalus]